MSLCALAVTLALAPQSPGSGSADHSAAKAAAAREIRHIPIREWLAPSPDPLLPRLGSFLGGQGEGQAGVSLLGGDEKGRQLIDRDTLLQLVHGFAPVDVSDVSTEVVGATLLVAGAADKVQAIESTVRSLTRAMVHEIRLQAELFRVPEARDFPATAARDQVAAIRDGLERVWTASADCVSGNLASLTKDRVTNYVYGVGVEVAQEAKIGDPITASVFEGIRVVIEPHALTRSSDVVLYAQVAFGELREPSAVRSTGIEDIPSLDVPSVDCNSGTLSARLADGGAALLSVQGDPAGGGNMLLMITALRLGRDGGDHDQLGIYPVSALLSRALRSTVRNAQREDERAFPLELQASPQDGRELGARDPESLRYLLTGALGTDQTADSVEIAGGHVIVKGAEAARQGAERILRALQDQWLVTARVDLVTHLHGIHFGDGVFPKGSAEGESSPRPLHQITFPALLGRPHVLVRGHETTVIRDNDVEIAQKAAISAPVVDEIFSGVVASLYLYPQQAGLGVEADLDLFDAPTPRRRVRETEAGGDLYLPVTGRSQFHHRGLVTSGRDVVLGDGPTVRVGDRSLRTQQILRVTLP